MTRLWTASQWGFWLMFALLSPRGEYWNLAWLGIPYATGLVALVHRWPPTWTRSAFAFLAWPVVVAADIMNRIDRARPNAAPPCPACNGTGTAPKETADA